MRFKAEERKKLKQITDLALDIQELGAHVFFNYSGHVDLVRVRVYKKGWKAEEDPDYSTVFYLSTGEKEFSGEGVKETIESLIKIKKELSKKFWQLNRWVKLRPLLT